MGDILNGLEKVVKAGIGLAAEGLEQAGKAVEHFAEKGEPAYEQAKEAAKGVVDNLKKTFTASPEAEQIKSLLKRLSRAELDAIAAFIDSLRQEKAAEEEDGAQEAAAEEAPAEEEPAQPGDESKPEE